MSDSEKRFRHSNPLPVSYERLRALFSSHFGHSRASSAIEIAQVLKISLEGMDYANIAANEIQIIITALLILVMGFALAMVPVMLYPIFKEYNEALALGSVVFRGALETMIYIAQAIILLLLLTMSQEYAAAGASGAASYQIFGTFLLQADHWLASMLSIVFGLGALMIYVLFYQSKLIPRWLSAWGLVGAVLYIAAPLLGHVRLRVRDLDVSPSPAGNGSGALADCKGLQSIGNSL